MYFTREIFRVCLGEFPSGQRGQTVNLLLLRFDGSNPSSPTTFNPHLIKMRIFCCIFFLFLHTLQYIVQICIRHHKYLLSHLLAADPFYCYISSKYNAYLCSIHKFYKSYKYFFLTLEKYFFVCYNVTVSVKVQFNASFYNL